MEYNIREILQRAVELDASDVHIKDGRGPVFRIHGKLKDSGFPPLDEKLIEEIVHTILPRHMAKVFHEDCEADFSHHEEGIGRFRVNVFMAQQVPTIAMRHVKTAVPTFEQLRLPPQLSDLALVERGIILLSGTTGSGKSTTLAAVIGEINRTQRRRIITVEDPVEYLFEDDQSVITQREVGLDTIGFQQALVHLMRQDPDVILIGEMRDQASIQTALLAAETGHLVLSTIHSGTAAAAVPRMLDVFPAGEHTQLRMALAANLEAVVCQRLVPDVHGSVIPACEILINTSTVRKLLERNQIEILEAAIETGGEDGMQTFNQSVYNHIKAGLITEEEGMRFATNPEALTMNLKGIFLNEGSRILGA